MNTTRPLMLGIVGDGGSGKATLTRGVARLIGGDGVTPICLDDYQRYDRAERIARDLSTADPAAHNLDLMAEQLATLRAGGTIQKPGYDYRRGLLRPAETVAATGLVIAYGMHTLTPPSLAGLFDLTIYLEPDDGLQRIWRFARDTRERGYAAEQVIALQPANDSAARRHIVGQRRYTDIVARPHLPADGAHSETAETIEVLLRRVPALASLEPLLGFVAQQALPGARVEHAVVDEDGQTCERLWIDAQLNSDVCQTLLRTIWPSTPDILTRSFSQIGLPNPGFSLVPALVSRLLAQASRPERA